MSDNWQIVAYNPVTLRLVMANAAPPTLGFETAVRMVPSFTGGTETDLAVFENKCEFILSNVVDNIKPLILKAILTQITGEAYENIKFREFQTWDELISQLKIIYRPTHSVAFLQKQLSSIKQKHDESIHSFSKRIENIVHQLTNALCVGKTAAESLIVAETLNLNALSVFIEGVSPSIQIILEARNINNFEEAVRVAIEKENKLERKNEPENKPIFNKRDKSNIKCHRCERTGHYANECRTNASKLPNFRNPSGANNNNNNNKNVEIKREFSSKYCRYCKKNNHDISECKRRIYNEKKKKESQEPSTSSNDRSIDEIVSNNVRVVTNIKNEHINCMSENFKYSPIQFLIDSGSEMNIIKISSLKGHLIVNEKDKKNIKGINSSPVKTVGSIITPMSINEKKFLIKFDIVMDDFPIPNSGIIGINFLKNNKVLLDWDKELFIIPEINEPEPIIIPPRSNCVLKIKADENIKHELITIKKHEINEEVILANSVSPVKDNEIIGNIINISEQPFVIDKLTSSNINWEPYDEQIYLLNEEENHCNRIKMLKESIKTDHLNYEEKDNIIELCSRFSDLFFFEGDKLSATDIVTHTINTPRLTKSVNIRPYRLPFAYQTEIEKQVAEMKEAQIIRESVSPFNFPLVVVKKKKDADGNQKLRVCVDFRKLNEITENEAYGLPNIIEILESLGSSKYFSTLNLASGYHQIRINEKGVTPDPNKIKCIKNYPSPKTKKEIKSFLSLLNYYRRFVDNFAMIAKPLTIYDKILRIIKLRKINILHFI